MLKCKYFIIKITTLNIYIFVKLTLHTKKIRFYVSKIGIDLIFNISVYPGMVFTIYIQIPLGTLIYR